MKEYKIEISYRTGNSFGGEDEISELELTWKNLDIAKENLQAIKEHWLFFQEIENWRTNNEDIQKKYQDKFWYVSPTDEFKYYNHHLMKLKADNGNFMQQLNFWCGHFETLYGAEIVGVDSDTKFTI